MELRFEGRRIEGLIARVSLGFFVRYYGERGGERSAQRLRGLVEEAAQDASLGPRGAESVRVALDVAHRLRLFEPYRR